jgi:hypothetical protein
MTPKQLGEGWMVAADAIRRLVRVGPNRYVKLRN